MNDLPPTNRDELAELVESLQITDRFDHDVERFEVIETHISLLLLTGPYVYKFKKPVKFNFLDFSSPEKRERICRREIELNRRLAPELYVDVVPITGSRTDPSVDGSGPVIEHAVRMKEFDSDRRFDRMIRNGNVTGDMIDRVVDRLVEFHEDAERVTDGPPSDHPEHLKKDIEGTCESLVDLMPGEDRVREAHEWLLQFLGEHRESLAARKADGFVRDVHGDLHLENVAWFEDRPVIYDCIEFNDSLRRIDVMNELAFPAVDLERIGRVDFSYRMVNRYLERTGDYEGATFLPLYKVYRAMVRAMVTAMKLDDDPPDEESRKRKNTRADFLDRMSSTMNREHPWLILMHGVTGSGKTTLSQDLLERLGAIRIRSDVERKRLHDVPVYSSSSGDGGEAINEGLYSEEATRRTYGRLRALAGSLLDAGHRVIVDATFLDRRRRRQFLNLAEERDGTAVLLDVRVPEQMLKERVKQRAADDQPTASDADLAVLEMQLKNRDPLTEAEREKTVSIRNDVDQPPERIVRKLRERLAGSGASNEH